MVKSNIFSTDEFATIESKTTAFLNSYPDFLSSQTARSTRTVGDAIEGIIAKEFPNILGGTCKEYSSDFARRAMADLAFVDVQGLYYVVDVKTHRLDTKFNMPNLTSIRRIARFYEDDNNYFVLLMVKYNIDQTKIKIHKTHFIPIEFLSWDCLTIGALGWGQIQIANSNNITINKGYSRAKWMVDLCDIVIEFYSKEIGKIGERTGYFEEVKVYWEEKLANDLRRPLNLSGTVRLGPSNRK